MSGGPENLPPEGAGFDVPPELHDIHAKSSRQLPGHILTGPVAVKGARPGDVLEVRILDVTPRQNWGWNIIRPLAGTLPEDFPTARNVTIPLDLEAGIARLSWGLELPLNPFFGVMGVAPPPGWGRISTIQPRAHGGNLDNKELVAGTTLFLPVFAEGALFSCGDGHGAQGDGEVCVTAIETALTGRFQLILHQDRTLACPRAETSQHFITMGLHEVLDRCAEMALRDMIALIVGETGISREDAYMLCSLAGDLRITQTVNGNKGVHMMLAMALLAVWTAARSWWFPAVLPQKWSLGRMTDAFGMGAPALAATLALAIAAASIATARTLWLLDARSARNAATQGKLNILIFVPLLLPQISFLFGLQMLFLFGGLSGTLLAVLLAQLVFVFPYAFLALSDPWNRLDPRYAKVATSMGASRLKVFWQVRLPLLLRPVLVTFAVAAAVSVGQYLPTLMIGAGRVVTVTTESVALASGGNRQVAALYAMLQLIIPLTFFVLAALVPSLVFRNRAAMRLER